MNAVLNPSQSARVLCQGAGYFAQFHYDAWRRIEGAEIVGAVELDSQKASATGAQPYADLNQAIERSRPDIVDIITPPRTHLATISTALDAGIKAIICQKPFCQNRAEASHAIALAAAANARLVIHENFRFQPWYRVIRQAMVDGRIGEWLQLSFRLRSADGQGPSAYLDRQPYFQQMPQLLIHETGIHFIDTFRYLLGEPTDVYADLRQLNPVIAGEDSGYFLFGFAQGKRALFDGNRLLDHEADNHRLTMGECSIEGTNGTLFLSGDGTVQHRRFADQTWHTLLAARSWPGFAGDCVHAFQHHAISAFQSTGLAETEASVYLQNIILEEQIYRSSALGRRLNLSGDPVTGGIFQPA